MSAITHAEALARVGAGLAKADEIGVAMNIAIVDAGGHLLQFSRQDGAWLGSVDIAVRKARTAALFRMPTSAIGEISQPGGPVYGIEHSNGGLVTFGGGLPITDEDGDVVGAVGVSGGDVGQDTAVAEAVAGAKVTAHA
ncbi:heme-binding protein [Streptomyces sp. NPDC006134]|uniref:GlcG/HbpS family heme-binding protein n=1 Tax=Streptomyces sp. NPDC006134 TaxID=3154467 RepID=UPI0033D741C8